MTTAILFHQLFEGLSLGIRIATLPPKDVESHVAVEDEENLRSTPPLASLQPTCYVPSIVPNVDTDPGAPSNSTLLHRHSRSADDSSSQTIGRGMQLQDSDLRTLRKREVYWLKPTLSILFAVTTPFGMCVGMNLWKDGIDPSLFLAPCIHVKPDLHTL